MSKGRIWELDFLRGVCIVCMVAVHATLDVLGFGDTGIVWFDFIRTWGSVLFLLLSGICVTLGHHPVRRGLIVFGGGILCTLVTYGMYFFHMADRSLIIWFGILHCLGVCMLLWPLLGKLPTWALGLLGAALIVLGFWFRTLTVTQSWLLPLGLTRADFASSDYFPLLPNLGYFLLGSVLGRTVYASKKSLLPKVNDKNPILRAFGWCGRQSLFIYLLHQPVLFGIFELVNLIRG